MKTQFEVASAATDGYFSKRYIAEKIFNISSEEFLRNQREMFFDRKFAAALDSSTSAIAPEPDEEGAGGAGSGLFGDLGSTSGTSDTPTPGEEEASEGEPDDILKVAPGKREDGEFARYNAKGEKLTTTPRSKGNEYRPKKDGRNSAMRRGLAAQAVPETAAGTTRRAIVGPAINENVEELFEGMVEKKETTYNVEESFEEHSKTVKNILESLERKNDKV